MDILNGLKKINLTDKEARVYLVLLELGPCTPYKVAKHTNLKRPTAYVIAEDLVKKGLIVQILSEKKRTYIARSPEEYFKEIEERVNEARAILPGLIALQKRTSEKPNILYFEGLSGVKQAYEYRLSEFHNTEILGLAAKMQDFNHQLVKQVVLPWNKYRKKHNIKLRIFTVDDPKLATFKEFFIDQETTKAKFLPQDVYDSDCTIEFFEFGIRIVMVQAMQAIIIESEKLSRTFKKIFELLWIKTKNEYNSPEKLKLSTKKLHNK